MTAKELMRPWKAAGLYLKTNDKRARACVVGEKRGGVEGKREGSFNIYVPLCLEYTLAPIPLLFPSTPHRAACHASQKKYNMVNNT